MRDTKTEKKQTGTGILCRLKEREGEGGRRHKKKNYSSATSNSERKESIRKTEAKE